MDRIIDLKNKGNKSQPQTGQDLSSQKTSTPSQLAATAVSNHSQANRPVSWSGQLHQRANTSAIIVAAVIFFGIAIINQIFQKNIITTVFFALISFVILLNSRRKSEMGRFEVNPIGVMINETRHTYKEVKSFWIEYDQDLGIQELSLQLKKWYAPYIKIPIYGQNPVQLRLTLLEFLPEVEHKDSIVEIVSRKLGI